MAHWVSAKESFSSSITKKKRKKRKEKQPRLVYNLTYPAILYFFSRENMLKVGKEGIYQK